MLWYSFLTFTASQLFKLNICKGHYEGQDGEDS